MMEEDPEAVLLDIRNRFESDAGKFEKAVVCDIEHFRELPQYVDRLESLKDKTVLMYCTGGIRCEKASALFRSKGFKNVFQLHGGIAAYQEQFGNEHWQGECFVFDQRMTVRVDEGLVQIGVARIPAARPAGSSIVCTIRVTSCSSCRRKQRRKTGTTSSAPNVLRPGSPLRRRNIN